MALRTIEACWDSPDHFWYLGSDHVGRQTRYDFTADLAWAVWRNGSPVPIKESEVPAEVIAQWRPDLLN